MERMLAEVTEVVALLAEWKHPLFIGFLSLLLLNIWFERRRRVGKCEYTFIDNGKSVKLKYCPHYHVFTNKVTKIPKKKVARLTTSDDRLSLVYKSGHTIDIVCGEQWVSELFDQTCFLFPTADFDVPTSNELDSLIHSNQNKENYGILFNT